MQLFLFRYTLVYLTYELVTVIAANQIADGSTDSAEANEEARDSAIDNATEKTGTGGGGSNNNNDDEWEKVVKEVKEMLEKYGIDSYRKLKRLVKGSGLEVHHLIEKRFAKFFKTSAGRFLSLPLSHEAHRVITDLWRTAIAYSNSGGLKLFFKLSFLEIFLYSLGVIPVLFLNIFIKHISFPYPQRSDISLTVISVVER